MPVSTSPGGLDDGSRSTTVSAGRASAAAALDIALTRWRQPEILLDTADIEQNVIAMKCDMGTQLCGSDEGHVHIIRHEMSEDNNYLKTTYTIYDGGKFVQNSVYHFERKR